MTTQEERARVPDELQRRGGLRPGVARDVARATGVPEADVYGVGSFYHLLSEPDVDVRVCQGLSCQMKGAEGVLAAAVAGGLRAAGCQCLAACDQPVAVLRGRRVLPAVGEAEIAAAGGVFMDLHSARAPGDVWAGAVGPVDVDADQLVLDLLGEPDYTGDALARADAMGADAVIALLEAAGLQGRGGAGFPAHIKWKGVAGQPEPVRYVVLNADEGEPGTFKDREVLLRRPDKVIEGLAIAARAMKARDVYLYLRGEWEIPWQAVEAAIARFEAAGLLDGLRFHMHAGQGAYICGEETALIEALEGKRGMPRLKPPFPVEVGLWGKPTLVHNVETIACVPPIVQKGGEWFKALGRTGAGTKLYCVSGHVVRPGIYELPLGVTLDELVATAGGYVGELKAFSPGGASSGFLPASKRGIPLDFRTLADEGSMLGSAGVVVLNETVDIPWAVAQQLRFFEAESCGQCAPCRIGTRFQRESLDRFLDPMRPSVRADALAHVADVAWQMNEGSICGLGQAASLPLTTALRWFPEAFGGEGG
ncbi:MAG: NADH-ubiquinone oxidoreductase-F iron-sulfur binding region domain-containing protein [Ardenticatenales bacterium]